jgi:hypothetical protein
LKPVKNIGFFLKYTVKKVRTGTGAEAGAKIFDKLEPEPHKNGPALQHGI